MAKTDIFDAFNDCIDRMNAGESMDDCVRDYPLFAERLRQLLGTGELVYRAQQYPASEVEADKQQVVPGVSRKRLLAPPPPPRRPSRVRPFIWVMTLATSILVVGMAMVVLLSLNNSSAPSVSALISTNSIADVSLQATQTAALQIALAQTADAHTSRPTATMAPSGTATATTTPNPTGTPAPTRTGEPGIVATSVSLLTPLPTAISGGGVLSPTPPGSSMEATAVGNDVALTATALSLPLNPIESTPTPAALGPLPTGILGATLVLPSPTALLPTVTSVQVLPLDAGEIDDNARWDTYLQYRNNYLQSFAYTVHDVDVTGRQIITVTDPQGLPVLGARVMVFNGQSLLSESRTDAEGQTLFFPNARPESRGLQSYQVYVEKDGQAVTFSLNPSASSGWNVVLGGSGQQQNMPKLDVLFLLDATGSMGDEIAQLRNNILGISAQIAQLSGSVYVRYGLVNYRDRGDAYVVQPHDFVSDVGTFQAILSQVQADGGGDYPESLNESLHDAVEGVSWRGDDTVKLIFLVADAPPHLDYPNDFDYAQEMVVAAQRGIKIHPIASSGLTPDGEYIFRQLAEYTLGHFLFLTYQNGVPGTPGDSRPELHVGTPSSPANQEQGDYTVEHLDELVLRLITDELAALKKPADTSLGIFPTVTPAAILPPALPPTITPTPTATSTPLPLPTVVGASGGVRPLDPPVSTGSASFSQNGLPIPFMLLMLILSTILGGLVVALVINLRRMFPPEKRKNDFIVEPDDWI